MNKKDLGDLATAYKLTFGNEMGKDVLEDLEHFCFGKVDVFTESSRADGSIDPIQMAGYEGRRSVLFMIKRYLETDLNETQEETFAET